MRYDNIFSLQWSAWQTASTEEAACSQMEKSWPEARRFAGGEDAEILMRIGLETDAPNVAEARAIIQQGKIASWEYRVRVRSA